MTNLIILGIGIISYIIVRSLINKSTIKMPVVYAGNPSCGKPNVREIPLPKNNPIYRDGDIEKDVSELTQLIVEGHSLEPLGIKDGSILFVERINYSTAYDLNQLIGRFIVFNIDNERTLREHPLKNITVEEGGLKARKAVKIVRTKQQQEQFTTELSTFLEKDHEYQKETKEKKDFFLQRIVIKYIFASDYYQTDDNLIMSITYKNGKDKDYSFHSPKFLYGIVKYNSI